MGARRGGRPGVRAAPPEREAEPFPAPPLVPRRARAVPPGPRFSRHEPAPQPQAVPERADGETGDGEAEVGDGVQGLPRLRGRLHEHAACKHRGVHRRCVVWTPG